jgi:hypothetical protein
MLFESPRTSVADQVYALGRNLPASMSSDQLTVIETVMHGMDTMACTVIGFLADQKQDGRASAAAADRARLAAGRIVEPINGVPSATGRRVRPVAADGRGRKIAATRLQRRACIAI